MSYDEETLEPESWEGLRALSHQIMAGIDVREHGVRYTPQPLKFYGSDQLHSCHQIALETLGLGNAGLRKAHSNTDCTMDLLALKEAIAEDRVSGNKPICVIATAGTVKTGAIDDLVATRTY